ncbi:hypothetical protein HDU88_009010 [Geranomyces variabilis]|nr:hypothetical protein HDU88_009010 [Geranomyces variabilis]
MRSDFPHLNETEFEKKQRSNITHFQVSTTFLVDVENCGPAWVEDANYFLKTRSKELQQQVEIKVYRRRTGILKPQGLMDRFTMRYVATDRLQAADILLHHDRIKMHLDNPQGVLNIISGGDHRWDSVELDARERFMRQRQQAQDLQQQHPHAFIRHLIVSPPKKPRINSPEQIYEGGLKGKPTAFASAKNRACKLTVLTLPCRSRSVLSNSTLQDGWHSASRPHAYASTSGDNKEFSSQGVNMEDPP